MALRKGHALKSDNYFGEILQILTRAFANVKLNAPFKNAETSSERE